jgi:hypothetical protein
MTNVARRSALGGEIIVVLRDCRFEHGRTKIWSIAEVFRPGIVRKECKAAREASTDVDVTGVIPALCAVLQQIDGADWKTNLIVWAPASRSRVGHISRQCCIWHKTNLGKRPAWTDWPRARRRIVNQVGALQVETVRSQVSNLERCLMPEAFLDRTAPLLDVLRRSMRVHGGEAYRSLAEHGMPEIELRRQNGCRGSEVIALLRFRENIRHVVPLVAATHSL